MIAYFNTGTTNSRLTILKGQEAIVSGKKVVGAKDVSISGSSAVLVDGLKELYDETLAKAGLRDNDISRIFGSGMLTSRFGIKEVPHAQMPITLAKLYATMYRFYEGTRFMRDIWLIRGARSFSDDFSPDRYNIDKISNMRGEETEVFGMGEEAEGDVNVIFPGSHTNILFMRGGALVDACAALSGEIFHALAKSSILANSIDLDIDGLDESMTAQGYDMLKKYGFARALYLVNTMQQFTDIPAFEKTSFLEGVIIGGAVEAYLRYAENNDLGSAKVIIAGSGVAAQGYMLILKQNGIDAEIAKPDPIGYGARGLIRMLKECEGYE